MFLPFCTDLFIKGNKSRVDAEASRRLHLKLGGGSERTKINFHTLSETAVNRKWL